MAPLYLLLALIGTIVPYARFIPWLAQHGLDLRLFVSELFSTRIGGFFGLDVLISAVVLIAFIRREGARRQMKLLWLPIAATCLIGVSCGLPLFLFLRERQLDAGGKPA
jgi:predicted exporter